MGREDDYTIELGADLHRAYLSGANLSGANLYRTKMRGANLTGTTMPDGSVPK